MKKILAILLMIVLLIPAPVEAATSNHTTQNMANLVLLVNFKGSSENTYDKVWSGNTTYGQEIYNLYFNGDNRYSLKTFIEKISYNQMSVSTYLPQYNQSSKTVVPITLDNNYSEYASGDDILKEAITKFNASSSFNSNVDLNNDGCVDNVTIIADTDGGNANILSGYQKSFTSGLKINNKMVTTYNFITVNRLFVNADRLGLIAHEFLHTVGYPDLYVNTGDKTLVGNFDIMSSNQYLRWPLAYLRSKISSWCNLETITTDSTLTLDIQDNKDGNQAYILKTPLNDNEVFVIEYRKSAAKTAGDTVLDKDIYNDSGIIVYRVNNLVPGYSNYNGEEAVYIFRQNDNGSASSTGMATAYLSQESGRTSYGSHDLTKTLADNALVYSNGKNSGIVISDVGSASGDSISCKVSFADLTDTGVWENIATTDMENANCDGLASVVGNDSYYLANNSDSNKLDVYQYNGSWSKIFTLNGNTPIMTIYQNTLYVFYLDSSYKLNYITYKDGKISSAQQIATEIYNPQNFSAVASNDGIYISYITNNAVILKKLDSSGSLTTVSDAVFSGQNCANVQLQIEGNDLYIAAKYISNMSQVLLKKYNSTGMTALESCTANATVNDYDFTVLNGKIYMSTIAAKNTGENTVYQYSNNSWKLLGDIITGEKQYTDCSIKSYNDVLYLANSESDSKSKVYYYEDGWKECGNPVDGKGYYVDLNVYDKHLILAFSLLDNSSDRKLHVKRYKTVDFDNSYPITEVRLDKTELSMKVNETATLEATIIPSYTTDEDKSLTWSSSDTSVATVSNGTVKAITPGTATITVKTSNGKTATCIVTVTKNDIAITGVSLNKTTLTIDKGSSETLTATITPSDTTDSKTLTWTSSNTSIATVDSNGKVTAVTQGSATITVKTSNGKAATCTVTVKLPITGVSLNKTTLTIDKGNTETLTASITPSDTTDSKTLTWTSSNASIVTVDSNGKVTAVAPGTATITVKTSNGKSATCTVTVKAPITGVTLNKTTLTIKTGNTETLTATINPSDTTDSKTLTWSSSSTSIATVDDNGKVTAVAPGTAIITVKTSNGKTTTCSVTVTENDIAITGVSLNKTTLTINKGSSDTLTATITPSNTTDSKTLTWSSSNTSIATVDSNGKVTAVAPGSATITVKTSNGKTATCTVTVKSPITGISLNKTTLTINKGSAETLTATITPSDTTDSKTLTWTSSNTSIATVDVNGKVTGVAPGSATITVKTSNGKSATCTVTVKSPITGISLNKTTLTINKGNSETLTTTITPSDTTDSKTLTWTSSNTSIATVDANGKVTAVAPGTATITVKTSNGKIATCTVTVKSSITGISLNKTTLTIKKGSTETLTATITPSDTTDSKTLTWSSSNTAVATVDNNGKITAVNPGDATITVKTSNGKSATCKVIVIVEAESVTLNKTSLQLTKGSSETVVNPKSGTKI